MIKLFGMNINEVELEKIDNQMDKESFKKNHSQETRISFLFFENGIRII